MSRELRWVEARRLVVHEGMSYEDAAVACDIPLSTLQKRAAAERWQEERSTGQSYAATVRALKAATLARAHQAMTDAGTDPQAATQLLFAWRSAETAWPEHRYAPAAADPKARLAVAAELLEQLVAYLERTDRAALAALAPHIAPFAAEVERAAA